MPMRRPLEEQEALDPGLTHFLAVGCPFGPTEDRLVLWQVSDDLPRLRDLWRAHAAAISAAAGARLPWVVRKIRTLAGPDDPVTDTGEFIPCVEHAEEGKP